MDHGAVAWARNGDTSIAWRAFGEGPLHLVFLTGFISHLEVILEEPGVRRFFERLAQSARVILCDRRGTGLSDRPVDPWTLADEVGDIEAVLDAAGADRAVLLGYAPGGQLAIEFATARPERSLAVVLYAASLANTRSADLPWANDPSERERRIGDMVENWGTGVNLDVLAPSAAGDERVRAWLGRLERQSMTPSGLQLLTRINASYDVRDKLEHVRVPTLILHRSDDQLIDVRHSRFAAERIAGARFVELPGVDSLIMIGDSESVVQEIEEFLTGRRSTGAPTRTLLTVLFTDVVEATVHAARLGDSRWRDLLAAHDTVIRTELARYGGHEVKTIGDAFLATFDGPPSNALRCARAIVREVEELGVEVRVGLHTGECEMIGDDVGGMAVHIAARVNALAGPHEVLCSGTVFGTVVGAGLQFEDRGMQPLKGVPGKWPIFALQV